LLASPCVRWHSWHLVDLVLVALVIQDYEDNREEGNHDITVMPIALMRASGTGLLIVLILKMGGLFAHIAFTPARPVG
jgi:hypothetical protein